LKVYTRKFEFARKLWLNKIVWKSAEIH